MRALLTLALAAPALAGCLSPQVNPGAAAPLEAGLVCTEPCKRAISPIGASFFEPAVAVDPANALHLVAGSIGANKDVDLSAAGQYHSWLYSHVSTDGGTTWSTTRLPGGPTAASDHPLVTATDMRDPVIVFPSDGTVLYLGVAGQGANAWNLPGVFAGGSTGATLFAARSHDGGFSYPEVSVIAVGKGLDDAYACALDRCVGTGVLSVLNDKPGVARGPEGTLLVTWTRRANPPGDGSAASSIHEGMVFSVSHDDGRTWSPPAPILDGMVFASPVIGSDGAYHVAFSGLSERSPIGVATSRDGGRSWEARSLGDTAWIPTLGIHRAPGGDRLFLTFPLRGEEEGTEAVVLFVSDDDGATWTGPLRLDEPEAPGRTLPAMAVAGDGSSYAAFYHPQANGAPADYRIVRVSDGVVGPPLVIDATAGMDGEWVGEYSGIAGLLSGAFPVWVAREGDFARIAGAAVAFDRERGVR